MKKIIIALVIILVAVIALFFYRNSDKETAITETPQDQASFDGKNITFALSVASRPITLINGRAEASVPGSASKNIITYFGNEGRGDLNGDGLEDVAFLITAESTGGSGLFYYVVAALKTSNGYEATNAFFVGDRIAPQTTEIRSRELHVNFAQRRKGDPMTASPSEGATLLLKVTPDGILEGLMK